MTPTNSREHEDPEAARPPGDERTFREILTGDIDIRIARDGTWFHEGRPIRRPALVKLFAGILMREADGSFHLVTPVEKRRITVEDAPFVAVELTADGHGAGQDLTLRSNVDDIVAVGPGHPIRVAFDAGSGEPSPYVMVRDGMEALIARPVYYELVALGEAARIDGREALVVRSRGETYVLGYMDDERAADEQG